MNDHPAKRPRYQFGLRKLLLWMFVVAVLLGTLKALGLESVWLAIGAFWVVITAAVRAAWGSTWAHVISAGGGGVLACQADDVRSS